MAALTERLALVIQGDASGAVQAFGLAGDAAKKANASAISGQNAFKASFDQWKQSPVAWAAVAATAGAALLNATNKAGALNEQMSAANITFGSAAAEVQSFAKTAVDSFGLSQTAALQASNSFAGLFKTAGLGPDATAQFSVALTKLGADIASFKDLAQGDVLGALRSGLTGEVEPLRRLDIILNDTTVTAKALALGLGDANGEVDDGAKVVARYALIMEQAKDKVGNFALTSDDLANSQRTLSSQLENLQTKVGGLTAGPLADLTTQLNNVLGALNKLPGGTSNVTSTLARVGAAVGSAGLSEVVRGITSRLGDQKSATEKSAAAQQQWAAALAASNNVARSFNQAIEQTAKDQKDLTGAVIGLVRARENEKRATEGIVVAQNGLKEAQAQLNRLQQQGAVDAEKVASAQRGLRDASRGVSDALRGQAEAQRVLDEVRKGANPLDLREAELNLTDAQRGQERSLLGVRKAQDEFNRLVSVGVLRQGQQAATIDDLKTAEIGLADSKLQVERSDIAAVRALERLNELRQQGKEGSKTLKDAEEGLRQSTENVINAIGREIDAHAQLSEALKGDPEFNQKMADARKNVAEKQEALAAALRGSRDAILQSHDAQDTYNEKLGVTADVTDRVRSNLEAIAAAHKGIDFSALLNLVPPKPAFNPIATLQGVAGATANPFGSSAQPIQITVVTQLDGRELARATTPSLMDQMGVVRERNGQSRNIP